MTAGDIVLLKYDAKFSRDRYRLAKVMEVHPDSAGVVRTVTVGLRSRHMKEKLLPYRSKPLTTFQVGIQRLVIVLPKEEQVHRPSIKDLTEDHEIVEEAGANDNSLDAGTKSREMKSSPKPRRSRRLQKLGPEVFYTKVAQGVAPPPKLEQSTHLPSAMICLFNGGTPMRVPLWMLELIDGHFDESDD